MSEHEHDEHCDHAFDDEMFSAFVAKVSEAADEIFRDGTCAVVTVRSGSICANTVIITGLEGTLSPTEAVAAMKDAIDTIEGNIAEAEKQIT